MSFLSITEACPPSCDDCYEWDGDDCVLEGDCADDGDCDDCEYCSSCNCYDDCYWWEDCCDGECCEYCCNGDCESECCDEYDCFGCEYCISGYCEDDDVECDGYCCYCDGGYCEDYDGLCNGTNGYYCDDCYCVCAVVYGIGSVNSVYYCGQSDSVFAYIAGSLPSGCDINWSGSASFSGSGTSVTATFNTIGSGLTISAKTGCQSGSATSQSFDVVGVADVIKNTGGTIYVGDSVILQAIPAPSSASFPSGKPVWTVTSVPPGAYAYLSPYSGSSTTTLSNLTIAGNYTVRATCGNSYDSFTVSVEDIEVNKIVRRNTTNEGPLYVSTGSVVYLKALPYPEGKEFPEGEPDWSIVSQPGSATLSSDGDEAQLSNITAAGIYIIKAEYGESYDEITIATHVELNLTACDLDGEVADIDEEDPGAFVHFNLDNDDDSDDSEGAPKHPGGDYLETTDTVDDEGDLESLSMSLEPSLSEGYVILSIPDSAKIWESDEKGFSNLVLDSGSKTWNLSNSSQRDDFLSLCSSLYVEGVDTGTGSITLKYENPLGTEIASDTIEYTFIAADCGNQPTISDGQRGRVEYGGLVRCEYSVTAGQDSNYNCIAWSVNDTEHWYEPIRQPWHGTNTLGIDTDFGNNDGVFDMNDVDDLYAEQGWELITTGTSEEKAQQAEAMYYPAYHAARRKSCSCGSGRWIMYESKLGDDERIEHVWDQLNDHYGAPTRFYK